VDLLLPRQERTKSYYTELARYWLSKEQLALFSDRLGLISYLKYNPELLTRDDRSIKEDLFESFFGALVTVIDEQINVGNGYLYAYQYFRLFLRDVNLLIPEEELFPAKTSLKELYDKLGWNAPRYTVISRPDEEETTVEVLDNDGDRLATGSGIDKREAENRASRSALTVLSSKGITREKAEAGALPDPLIDRLRERVGRFLATKGNYGLITLPQIYRNTNPNFVIAELMVIQDPDTAQAMRVSLGITGKGNRLREAQVNTLQNFIKRYRVP